VSNTKTAKTQFHQGVKLKKIVEKSGTTIKELLKKSGISRGTLYNFFEYEDIPRKKLSPLLEVLEVDPDVFYGFRKADDIESVSAEKDIDKLKLEVDSLKRERELLQQLLQDKEDIILLLKNK